MKQCQKMFHKDEEVHKGNNATEAKPIKIENEFYSEEEYNS